MRSACLGNPELGFILDGGVHVVYDEYFEGAAVEHSFPPDRGASNYGIRSELSGTVRLEIVRDYF
jgi:hypothetical protein